MFTRKELSFIGSIKSIIFNQRGSIGEESAPAEEAPIEEEISEEIQEEDAPISEDSSEEIIQANTEAELEEEIQDAIEDGASEEEVKNMIRQFTLKVDGKEFVKEIDLNDQEAIIRELQMSHKGQKSMQELQELKNTYASELRRLVANPFDVLSELDEGFDPLKLSADYINKKYQESEMSPKEKADAERNREYEELKAERDRLKSAAEQKEKDAQNAALAQELESDIMSALDGDTELIADRETVRLVAKELHWAMKNGYDLTAKEVLPTVKDQLRQQFRQSAERFKSTAALKEYMGKNLLDKLREDRVEQAKKKVKSVNDIKKDVANPAEKKEESKKVALSSLFR